LNEETLTGACGIAMAERRLARDSAEATALASEIGFPVVLKIASRQIPHKSDIGGVLQDLGDEQAVVSGYATLMERVRAARPDAKIEGVHVQRQIGEGQDVIIGAVRDPDFGPLMMVGSGGIEVEGLRDISFALAPLSDVEAREMLRSTWAGRKLAGYRSLPPADEKRVIEALVSLSWLAHEQVELEEIEWA
jgi:acyl-CoA synthetase (NDP forming)